MNERVLKALSDLKSDMCFVKKYMAGQEQARHTKVQVANPVKFGKKYLENVQQSSESTQRKQFAGVASKATSIP